MPTFFRNCSLFRQLIVPMVVVGTIGVGALIASALVLHDSVVAVGASSSLGSELLRRLQEIDKAIANARILGLKHLASESAEAMGRIGEELAAQKGLLATDLLPGLGSKCAEQDPAVLREIETLGQAIERYFVHLDEAVRLSREFEKERAFDLLFETEGGQLVTIRDSLRMLARHAFDDITASRENLLGSAERNLRVTIAIGILGGLVLLVIAFYVSGRTSARLGDLLAWARRIAAGDLKAPAFGAAHDEVGQLAGAMGEMVHSLAASRHALETAKQEAEGVAERLRLYANAFANSGEAMLITDRANRILNANAAFTRQTGYALADVLGQDPKMLACGRTPPATLQEMWRELRAKGYWQGELWDRKKSGEVYPKWTSISSIRDEQGEVMFYLASYSDISERKANEARIDYLAHHDALTGLINRYNLENRLGQVLLSAQRDRLCTAVLFIDMDRFKTINDTLGHHVGDQLLIEVARRLRDAVRESDIVARLGGDEFVVVLTALNGEMDAAPVADKILRALSDPYAIEGAVLHSSPSIGIAIAPNDGQDGASLMKNADTAMYHAKAHGRNNAQFFTAAMNAAASERLALENDLRQAMQEGLLSLHYQPQVRAADGCCFGVEALARWRHATRGDVSPLQFIPIAEESGLIDILGTWVLDESCRQLSAWRRAGIGGLRMAVNLSAHQLRAKNLVRRVADALERHGLAGGDLELEITESAAMENPERAIEQLHALRALGVALAIDDFGTGYSSLAYLKRLPIQVLKLDRSFVRDIEIDQSDADISAASLALARNLGLKVVAEGVETPGQRDFLVRHGCDYLQGYLYSKPLPAEGAERFIRAHPPAPA
jgi:diguanylate cyclase (GGDEF)-like protein/PAS domain S-box-containing protein